MHKPGQTVDDLQVVTLQEGRVVSSTGGSTERVDGARAQVKHAQVLRSLQARGLQRDRTCVSLQLH